MEEYCLETAWGWVALAFTEKGLFSVSLPREGLVPGKGAKVSLGSAMPQMVRNNILAMEGLRLYFQGTSMSFRNLELDFTGYSEFARGVFLRLREVPFGEVISYKELARSSGNEKAARAVGAVLRSNRFLIVVPCHRVISSSGKLGGFASGLEWKRKLLWWESFIKEGHKGRADIAH